MGKRKQILKGCNVFIVISIVIFIASALKGETSFPSFRSAVVWNNDLWYFRDEFTALPFKDHQFLEKLTLNANRKNLLSIPLTGDFKYLTLCNDKLWVFGANQIGTYSKNSDDITYRKHNLSNLKGAFCLNGYISVIEKSNDKYSLKTYEENKWILKASFDNETFEYKKVSDSVNKYLFFDNHVAIFSKVESKLYGKYGTINNANAKNWEYITEAKDYWVTLGKDNKPNLFFVSKTNDIYFMKFDSDGFDTASKINIRMFNMTKVYNALSLEKSNDTLLITSFNPGLFFLYSICDNKVIKKDYIFNICAPAKILISLILIVLLAEIVVFCMEVFGKDIYSFSYIEKTDYFINKELLMAVSESHSLKQESFTIKHKGEFFHVLKPRKDNAAKKYELGSIFYNNAKDSSEMFIRVKHSSGLIIKKTIFLLLITLLVGSCTFLLGTGVGAILFLISAVHKDHIKKHVFNQADQIKDCLSQLQST